MDNQRLAFLSAITVACAAGYGCGGEVLGSGSTGTGGSSTTSSQGGATSDVAVSASSGFGGDSAQSGSVAVSSSVTTGAGGSLPGCQPKTGVILAVTKMYFGDTDLNDAPDKVNGWRHLGFNLDNKVSTASSVDLCKPASNNNPKNVYPDGDNGNDNSFGKNILQIFLGIAADSTTKANQAITDGDYTLILDLEGLGAGANQAPVAGKVYTGTSLMMPPKLDGSDCWPVAPEGLQNPMDIASAKPFFPMGNVSGNHWDSGALSATVPVQMNFGPFNLNLLIHHARLTMDLDADHLGSPLGMIGGVLDSDELVAEMKMVAAEFDPSLCNGPTIDSISAQLMAASDILKDGTQDPSKMCDGISIGLGFKAKALSLGVIGPATPAPPNPCVP